jgi:hypothetical protein
MKKNMLLKIFCALLLISCYSYSQQEAAKVRIGTFDSRCIAMAYGRTDFLKNIEDFRTRHAKAKEDGSQELIKEMGQLGPTKHVVMNQQASGKKKNNPITYIRNKEVTHKTVQIGRTKFQNLNTESRERIGMIESTDNVDFKQDESTGLFKFIKKVEVTPDAQYLTGCFSRINYVPATDRFVATFGGMLAEPSKKGFSFKEYTTDMVETGNSGVFANDVADAGSIMIENTYYHAGMSAQEGIIGWNLCKYDAVNWNPLIEVFYPLVGFPRERECDPMVAFVNGQIDVSAQFNDNENGDPPPEFTIGAATHHHFFSLDFEFLSFRVLNEPQHICGSSMIYVDSLYYFISANAFVGDVILMIYDHNWNFIDSKVLAEDAHWSTGLAFDGQMFYLAYINTSRKTEKCWYLNTRLAAFDRNWNLIEDIPVTDFTSADSKLAGRPWVIHHDNHLYVSFDVDSIDANTFEEMHNWQAYVSVYELTPSPSSLEPVERVPKVFYLEQNYPNPFNPTTSIQYAVSSRQFVTLKIYDVLGNEVGTLISEEKEAGTYEVEFNAEKLSSGVYFYQLRAGSFVETKKMILLR